MSRPWSFRHDQSPPPEQPRAHRRARLPALRARLEDFQHRASDLKDAAGRTTARSLLISGQERHGSGRLRLLYVGDEANFAYLTQLLFAEFEIERTLPRRHAWQAPRAVAHYEREADLVAVDVGWPYSSLFHQDDYLVTPAWVNQSFFVKEHWQDNLAVLRRDARRNDLKRVAKHGLSAHLTRLEPDHRDFYRTMYEPYVRRRFSEATVLESEGKVCEFCASDGLLQVCQGERKLSGMVLNKTGSTLQNLWLGLADGLSSNVTSAALGAVYYFSLVYAYESGFRVLDFCASRSMLDDGVLRYKRKWGAVVHENTDPSVLLLKPRNLSRPVVTFFVENPWLTTSTGEFRAHLLAGVEKPLGREDLEAIVDRYEMSGLRGFDLCSLKGFDAAAHSWARARQDIDLRDLSSCSEPRHAFTRRTAPRPLMSSLITVSGHRHQAIP